MLEQVAEVQSAILQAPPEIVIPAAMFLLLVVVPLLLALPERQRAAPGDRLEAAARRWIGDRIDQHVEALAAAYGGAAAGSDSDDMPPGFAMTNELFIAEGLLRAVDSEGFDVELRTAVRAFAVLHREDIYQDVMMRTRKAVAAD